MRTRNGWFGVARWVINDLAAKAGLASVDGSAGSYVGHGTSLVPKRLARRLSYSGLGEAKVMEEPVQSVANPPS